MLDLILFNFSKAFDVVCHAVLINKLRCIGIQGYVLDWLNDFLMGRLMQVIVKNCNVSSLTIVMLGA